MINVVHDTFEFQVHFSRRGLALDPARHHHPRIQHSADYGSSFDESFDLFIRELAVMSDEGATIRMAGPETTRKMVVSGPAIRIVAPSSLITNRSISVSNSRP